MPIIFCEEQKTNRPSVALPPIFFVTACDDASFGLYSLFVSQAFWLIV
jgi:hypothetical protein